MMKKYGMFLRKGKDIVHITQQKSIKEAIKYFAEVKKMLVEEFKKIFVVKEIINKNENYGNKKRF